MVPRKTLYSELYVEIYKEFKTKFIEKEWADGGEPGAKYEVWKKKSPDGNWLVDELFQVRFDFFYNNNILAESGEDILLKQKVLDKVLIYVGCLGESTASLLESFYKEFKIKSEIVTAQQNVKPKKKSEKKGEKESRKNIELVSAENVNHKTVNNISINVVDHNKDLDDGVAAIVYEYYRQVDKNNDAGFRAAWTFLSDSFKNRIWIAMARKWEANKSSKNKAEEDNNQKAKTDEEKGYELFKDGYFFFRSLSDTHVFNTHTHASTAEFIVYYEETLELPFIEELADINRTSVKNIRSLIDRIEALAKIVEDFGGQGFHNKALIRLFYPTPTETIWFEHGMDHVAFKEAYPNTSSTKISRLLKGRCVKEDGVWLIDGLIPLHCRQL